MTKRKKLFAVAGVALACLVCLTVARCTSIHAPADVSHNTPDVDAPSEAEQAGGGAGVPDSQDSQDKDALALLNDAARAKIASYDADTLDFMALLETNKWSDAAQTSTLAFKANTYSISHADGTATPPVAFAVTALETEALGNGGPAPLKTYTASVSSAQGDYLMRVDRSSDGTWRVTSSLFGGSKQTYYMVADLSELKVDADMSALDEATGKHAQTLAKALKAYCADWFPTAREATWTGEATCDYAKHTVSIAFVLDNRAASRVEVVYDEQAQTIAFGNAKNRTAVSAADAGDLAARREEPTNG